MEFIEKCHDGMDLVFTRSEYPTYDSDFFLAHSINSISGSTLVRSHAWSTSECSNNNASTYRGPTESQVQQPCADGYYDSTMPNAPHLHSNELTQNIISPLSSMAKNIPLPHIAPVIRIRAKGFKDLHFRQSEYVSAPEERLRPLLIKFTGFSS